MREFDMFSFAAHVGELVGGLAVAEHQGLEKAAVIIETEAKAEIGEYQGDAGPFGAWPDLADSTKADRVHHGFPEDEPLLRTGEMRDSIGHVVLGHEAHIGSDDDRAVWQELGTVHIPPRSFLGHAAVTKAPEVANIIGREIFGMLTGEALLDEITGEHVGEVGF